MVARGFRASCLEPGDNSVELEIDVPDARLGTSIRPNCINVMLR